MSFIGKKTDGTFAAIEKKSLSLHRNFAIYGSEQNIFHDVLHTFGKEYLMEDLTEYMKEKGVLA